VAAGAVEAEEEPDLCLGESAEHHTRVRADTELHLVLRPPDGTDAAS
jgi:hypothetical protein